MDPLTLKEKRKYELLFERLPEYRRDSPGEMFVDHFLECFKDDLKAGDRLIDFGCGSGKVAKIFLMKNLDVTLVDFCSNCLDEDVSALTMLLSDQLRFVEACLWDLPKELTNVDWIYCCDVLEHIPESQIDAVLKGMAERTEKGGYLSICLKEELNGNQLVGEPLHLTVRDKAWWKEKVSTHWQIHKEVIVFEELYFNCCILRKNNDG